MQLCPFCIGSLLPMKYNLASTFSKGEWCRRKVDQRSVWPRWPFFHRGQGSDRDPALCGEIRRGHKGNIMCGQDERRHVNGQWGWSSADHLLPYFPYLLCATLRTYLCACVFFFLFVAPQFCVLVSADCGWDVWATSPGVTWLRDEWVWTERPDRGRRVWAKVAGTRHGLRLREGTQVSVCHETKRVLGSERTHVCERRH